MVWETARLASGFVRTPSDLHFTTQFPFEHGISMSADTLRFRFNFESYGFALYPPGSTFGPVSLRDYEFVWIIEGNVAYECNGKSHPAPAGSLMLSRPGMRHAFIWDPQHQSHHGYFHFGIEGDCDALPPQSRWPLLRRLGEDDIIRPLFHHLMWLFENRCDGWQDLAQGAMRQALIAFVTGGFGTARDDGADLHPTIERLMAHVQGIWAVGPMRSIPLSELASAADVSQRHLNRVLREALGVGPVEALRLLRLSRAATLLARTNHRVQDIAAQTGFDSPFHFSRAFSGVYGCSPRAFRKLLDSGADTPSPHRRMVRVRKLSSRIWQRE